MEGENPRIIPFRHWRFQLDEDSVDHHGLLDLDPNVRSGYREVRVKLKVKGDPDEVTIQELVGKSPVFNTLAEPEKTKIEVE